MAYTIRQAACAGKQAFDRATANRVARETNQSRATGANTKRKTQKPRADAYKCKFCGHWHVGHARRKAQWKKV